MSENKWKFEDIFTQKFVAFLMVCLKVTRRNKEQQVRIRRTITKVRSALSGESLHTIFTVLGMEFLHQLRGWDVIVDFDEDNEKEEGGDE